MDEADFLQLSCTFSKKGTSKWNECSLISSTHREPMRRKSPANSSLRLFIKIAMSISILYCKILSKSIANFVKSMITTEHT